jgi:fructose-bisphosphate aldolase, class I
VHNIEQLERTARFLVTAGKGILAADESTRTMTKRLEANGLESTPESRRRYREMLLLAPGLEEHISGVILYHETFGQDVSGGRPFPRALAERAILPGIKVDTGAKPLAGAPGETVTEGLDSLRERLEGYGARGARFAKWRAVIAVDEQRPTARCVEANAHALARYAALCQEAGIVPIVEPEVLMDGEHSIERCAAVTERVQRAVFFALTAQGVALEGIVLKPNMVVPGATAEPQATVDEVADATLRVLRRTVPAAVPGVAFLSGGQSPELATAHLQALAARGPHPWQLTFSYGRALQDPALAAWSSDDARMDVAREALLARVRANGAARDAAWSPDADAALAA